MISYDRYTELLSKIIYKNITPAESKAVEEYETSTPEICPKCGDDAWTFLEPYRVAHDVEKCAGEKLSSQPKT
jgi:hypothetical protein